MNVVPVLSPLVGWSVICLRPSRQQAAVRRAVRVRGAHHVSLPGISLAAMPDYDAALNALNSALQCEAVVFTSPAAVNFAAKLRALTCLSDRRVFSVGEGTTRALAAQKVQAISPAKDAMNSEGVLASNEWSQVRGPVGIITAPGGRGAIPAGLMQRGFEVIRADVYRRNAPRLDRRHQLALMSSPEPRAVLISSGEALLGALALLPEAHAALLRDSWAVVSSQRLETLAKENGFSQCLTATAPTAEVMLDCLAIHALSSSFR